MARGIACCNGQLTTLKSETECSADYQLASRGLQWSAHDLEE